MKIAVGFSLLATVFALVHAAPAFADTFGTGSNQFTIDFVTIGNPNNPPDLTGDPVNAGSVPYSYRIGKFEISADMVHKAAVEGDEGVYGGQLGLNKPVTGITWDTAARFVNWLNTSSGYTPAYKFNGSNFELWQPGDFGFDSENLFRNSEAFYFLPSEDEWYKAAYYDPAAGIYYDYPTGRDTVPDGIDSPEDRQFEVVFDDGFLQQWPNDITNVGVLSPYGTAGQGGNVWEMLETEFDLVNDLTFGRRSIRGGPWTTFVPDYMRSSSREWHNPQGSVSQTIGFRVASVATIPEPRCAFLCIPGLVGLAWKRQRVRRLRNAKDADTCRQ